MRPLSEIERNRIEKVRRLREAGSEPYPPRVRRTHTTAQALAAFAASPEGKPEAAIPKIVEGISAAQVIGVGPEVQCWHRVTRKLPVHQVAAALDPHDGQGHLRPPRGR